MMNKRGQSEAGGASIGLLVTIAIVLIIGILAIVAYTNNWFGFKDVIAGFTLTPISNVERSCTSYTDANNWCCRVFYITDPIGGGTISLTCDTGVITKVLSITNDKQIPCGDIKTTCVLYTCKNPPVDAASECSKYPNTKAVKNSNIAYYLDASQNAVLMPMGKYCCQPTGAKPTVCNTPNACVLPQTCPAGQDVAKTADVSKWVNTAGADVACCKVACVNPATP